MAEARQLVGMPELRAQLEAAGFWCAPNGFAGEHNACNWYAWRRSSLKARECECNDGKPAQVVVTPHAVYRAVYGPAHESAEVEIRGEAGGVWYSLKAYSILASEVIGKLPQIESALVAAWNALVPEPAPMGMAQYLDSLDGKVHA